MVVATLACTGPARTIERDHLHNGVGLVRFHDVALFLVGRRPSPRRRNEIVAEPLISANAAGRRKKEEIGMLGWAITFLLVALVAAFLGFGGVAAFAVDAARIVFFVAIILFVISAVISLIRGRTPTAP